LLVLVAVGVAVYVHNARHDAIVEAETNVALQPDPRFKGGERQAPPPGAIRGTLLALGGGLFMGLSRPVLDLGRIGEDGVAPYGAALLVAGGLFLAAFFFGPFFCAFPVRGRSLRIRDYIKGAKSNHFLGLAGGMVAGIGILCSFLVWGSTAAARTPVAAFAAENLAAVLAGILGLILWKEFAPADARTRMLFSVALLLFAVGVGVASLGQS
jgi:hypothetical protein